MISIFTSRQIAPRIIMVAPDGFSSNPETLESNAFQNSAAHQMKDSIRREALKEFEEAVNVLRSVNVDVLVHQSAPEFQLPDSVFPNNWFSTDESGILVLYPMFANARRGEKNCGLLEQLSDRFELREVIDHSTHSSEGAFLEGTGSMVLDRINQIAYACLSPRTTSEGLRRFAQATGFTTLAFEAFDQRGIPFYHTNVMMSVGEAFSAVCLDSIRDDHQRLHVERALAETGKEIVELSQDQVEQFCGNILEIENQQGKRYIAMSKTAFHAFDQVQLDRLSRYATPLPLDIPTIERYGGGSVRCMIAENFLPVRNHS